MDYKDEIEKRCKELEKAVDKLFEIENKLNRASFWSWILLRHQESRMKKILNRIKEKSKKVDRHDKEKNPKKFVYGGCEICKAMNCDCPIDFPDAHQGNKRKKV